MTPDEFKACLLSVPEDFRCQIGGSREEWQVGAWVHLSVAYITHLEQQLAMAHHTLRHSLRPCVIGVKSDG